MENRISAITGADRDYNWMCRVIKDSLEYKTNRAVVQHAVHSDDRDRMETATRESPVSSWSGRCLYWREKRSEREEE